MPDLPSRNTSRAKCTGRALNDHRRTGVWIPPRQDKLHASRLEAHADHVAIKGHVISKYGLERHPLLLDEVAARRPPSLVVVLRAKEPRQEGGRARRQEERDGRGEHVALVTCERFHCLGPAISAPLEFRDSRVDDLRGRRRSAG